MNAAKIFFDHEKLIAYQRGIQFVAWSSQLLDNLPPRLAVCDQLEGREGAGAFWRGAAHILQRDLGCGDYPRKWWRASAWSGTIDDDEQVA